MRWVRRRGSVGGALVVLAATAALLVRFEAYPFLAMQAPVESDVLVVEGWVVDEVLARAAAWGASNGVRKIVATGGPIETGSYLTEWKTYAEMTVARMEKLGLGETFELAAAPAEKVRRGRTRESARALRAAWGGAGPRAFNLASEGFHARRSWRAFRDVFGEGTAVGCVALEPTGYDGSDWWSCSEGVRSMVGEWVAYLYDLAAGGSQ